MHSKHRRSSGPFSLALALLAACNGACNGGSGPAPTAGSPPAASGANDRQEGTRAGDEIAKPGGGTFFVDPHQGGRAPSLRLLATHWGRLVDVHDVDAAGALNPIPRFRDFVIDPTLTGDGRDTTLEELPLAQRTRLVIHAKKGSERFARLLQAAARLPELAPKHDDGTSAPPFDLVPRNACFVLRFDDLLADDPAAALALASTVQLRVGTPPLAPFAARVVFDANHGGLVGGAFHSTRVLVDLSVSELEARTSPIPLALNPLGLPEGRAELDGPGASLRIPTKADAASGQVVVLTNLLGNALDRAANGPLAASSPTLDVVRALRPGSAADASNGFLLDLVRPRVLADLAVVIQGARRVRGDELALELAFTSACRRAPARGDVLTANGVLLEILAAARPDPAGLVRELAVRALEPVATPASLLGNALLHVAFPPRSRLPAACFLAFTPAALAPGSGVAPEANVGLRFSEPMQPEPFAALDAMLVVRGPGTQGTSSAGPTSTVLGAALPSPALDRWTFAPVLPLAHAPGAAETYHVELGDARDLAGNPLAAAFPFVDFHLDPSAAAQQSAALVLRFGSADELGPDGLPDLRGQFFYDFDRGELRPRPVVAQSWPVDRTRPVPSLMFPFPPGVRDPLIPLGSKVQALWRYCDFGWNVRDETKHNLDVLELAWAPVGGNVITDFFEGFEIRLAHARFLPDEAVSQVLLPRYPNSGLRGHLSPFSDNVLVDPLSPQTVVHPRALGYSVRPADAFTASTGTRLVPYPLNRGPGPRSTYTWRDTAVLAKAGPNNAGIPTDIEVGPPLFLEPQFGTVASAGNVPSFGLPLLVEFRCYPTDRGLGINALDVSFAINSSPQPSFRVFSSGGVDLSGTPVTVDPDTAVVPAGGFDPGSNPPGQRTLAADNVSYLGQLDTLTRLSRAHTIWLDTASASPTFLPALVGPAPGAQPAGTAVQLAFRGAVGFTGAGNAPFDARQLDAYGELANGSVDFLGGVRSWTADLAALNGARYVQVRATFVGNATDGAVAALSLLGLPFIP
jgi:hypothetical protein